MQTPTVKKYIAMLKKIRLRISNRPDYYMVSGVGIVFDNSKNELIDSIDKVISKMEEK